MHDLPEAVYIEGRSIKAPLYKLLGPIQADDTYYEAGEIISTSMCPNEAMEPMNRAAGDNVEKWYLSLPANGNVRTEDYMAAAMEMRPKVGDQEISHDEWIAAVRQRALTIRAKAEGRPVEDLMPARITKPSGDIPPMPNVQINSGQAMQAPRRGRPPNVQHVAQEKPNRVKPEPVGGIRTESGMQPTS